MPYKTRTYNEILEELKAEYAGNESLVEGGFVMDVFESNAIEFHKTELELTELYKESFGDTAEGEYLEKRAAEHGVIRRGATKSKGQVIVTGKGTVYKGAIFATSEGVRFVALESVEIEGSGEVEVEAQKAGAQGNVGAGTVVKIPLNIAGIHTVTNESAMTDGYDAEDDDTFKERFLLKVRRPSTTGNPADYIHFCLSIEGVGAVTVLRNPFGRGTVGLWLIDSDLRPANDSLIERVAEKVATFRPIGAQVYVDSAIPLTIDISADIQGTIDLDSFKSSTTNYFKQILLNYEPDYSSVESYTDTLDAIAGYITRSKIGKLILNAGASDYDYDSIRLNNTFNDISLTAVQLPILGNITFRQIISA